MADCTVYIDEAGDLGVGRGTKWFVLSAVVVEKTYEAEIRQRMNAIKNRLNIRDIHFRKVADFTKRGFIACELSELEFTYMNVLVDTSLFDRTKIPDSNIAYNYVCKYLLQRVSWYLCDHQKSADIVLSARGTSRDGELITYIKEKLFTYPDNKIDPSLFQKVEAKAASQWELLQLADVCATTMFLTYEVNGWGFCVPCYSNALSDHLYKRNNAADSYGIKFFQNNMKPNVEELRKHRICAKKERAPGATAT